MKKLLLTLFLFGVIALPFNAHAILKVSGYYHSTVRTGCYRVYVVVTDTDDLGESHVIVSGYVNIGPGCGDIGSPIGTNVYNGEYFETDEGISANLCEIIQGSEVYPQYTVERDRLLNEQH